MEPAVSLTGVGVRFRVKRKERANPRRFFYGFRRTPVWALRGIDLRIEQKEAVGIIGPNGAGKTTLLRAIGGIFEPDEGEREVRGSIGTLISPSAGLVSDLTGNENILLNGVLFGLDRKQARVLAEEIGRFTRLGEWLDSPVRTYSSGMKARLGFSIATAIQPDVLLLDEVLGVGDQDFRERSSQRIDELIRGGRTVVLSTHNLSTLSETCSRVIRLERGEIVDEGEPDPVIDRYIVDKGGDVERVRRRGNLKAVSAKR